MIKNEEAPRTARLLVESLAARRGEDVIFSDLNLALGAGDALVVTGANGTGKSTFLRVLAGLLRPDAGQVVFYDGAQEAPRPLAEASHYLGHRNAMKQELTARENLLFWRRFCDATTTDDEFVVEEAADAVGLSDILHLPFGYLSAGQQRRLAFAKLLVASRSVWLLDEPTTALDSQADKVFAKIIDDHRAKGGIVCAATHRQLGLLNARELHMQGFSAGGESAWG
ncbi:heme ABC exporter ATP-binding protein CcmA [Oryzifoliimicrobium ureilyticus]|uniref:heme ABC exporter ATP-binding protein CcmA n=1 Tax=Oryzifoliimicrobium ureilyticus TaxID=3113724 RepID=UPI00307605DD